MAGVKIVNHEDMKSAPTGWYWAFFPGKWIFWNEEVQGFLNDEKWRGLEYRVSNTYLGVWDADEYVKTLENKIER